MTTDERLGIAWWNNLTEADRRYWMAQAGSTGRAWETFKRLTAQSDQRAAAAAGR